MTPSQRKLALTVHVACSVGLLGSIAVFLALAVAALTVEDGQAIRSAYLSMDLTARLVIVPLAFASLVTGLIQAIGTPWGLFRHYWVLAKLVLTVLATIVLLGKMELIAYAARLAAETVLPTTTLYAVGIELAVHAGGGLLVLLIPTVLSIYKPWGLTTYGRRVQRQKQTPSNRADVISQQQAFSDSEGIAGKLGRGTITITLRRAYVFGILLVIVVLHFAFLHVQGTGLGVH